MKLHNFCLDDGSSIFGHSYASDVSGQRDPMAARRARAEVRVDHLGRARAVDETTVHVSGPNRQLAAVEAARAMNERDREAAREARLPAWYDDIGLSPRDPVYITAAAVCQPRALITERMKDKGYTRRREVHWQQ